MRSILITGFSIVVLTASLAAQSSQPQSLGDYARQQRQNRKQNATRVITNEELANTSGTVTTAAASAAADTNTAGDKAAPKQAKEKDKEAKDTAAKPAETESTSDAQNYRKAVQKQRAEVAKLEKEIADADQKIKTGSTNYYMDAGTRLRDPKAWTEQRTKLDAEIATKQQKLQEARTKLDDMLEQARKLGISSSSLE